MRPAVLPDDERIPSVTDQNPEPARAETARAAQTDEDGMWRHLEDDAAAEEAEPADTQEAAADAQDQFPVWTALGIGAGALALIALSLVLVRRRLKQND